MASRLMDAASWFFEATLRVAVFLTVSDIAEADLGDPLHRAA